MSQTDWHSRRRCSSAGNFRHLVEEPEPRLPSHRLTSSSALTLRSLRVRISGGCLRSGRNSTQRSKKSLKSTAPELDELRCVSKEPTERLVPTTRARGAGECNPPPPSLACSCALFSLTRPRSMRRGSRQGAASARVEVPAVVRRGPLVEATRSAARVRYRIRSGDA